ncbi:hypothetical protein DIPPA_18914 [Diplonema papillatum]|nr:hypothetical protein DIPPA_18914 [Diplonema papillatum]
MDSVPRALNAYESMLATGTCNVCLRVHLPCAAGEAEGLLRAAWAATVHGYAALQCRLVPSGGEAGPLGPGYDLVPWGESPAAAFEVGFGPVPEGEALVRVLQTVGTTRLHVDDAVFAVSCVVGAREPAQQRTPASVAFTLSHAVSDGRGALEVAHRFLQHLSGEGEGERGPPHAAVDVQAAILSAPGGDLGAGVYPELDAVRAGVLPTGEALLPAEGLQGMPKGVGTGERPAIEAVLVRLSKDETSRLRDRCREHGASVQGAVSTACLVARVGLLSCELPVAAPLLVPADCRSLGGLPAEACLCASAGLWQVARLRESAGLLETAGEVARAVRASAAASQHREWLRRLLRAPGELPPHALMASSVGVAPVREAYGGLLVEECLFFGGAVAGDPAPGQAERQATMVHAVTFAGRLHLMCNYTAPGISRGFAEDTARVVKAALVAMADDSKDVPIGSFLKTQGTVQR